MEGILHQTAGLLNRGAKGVSLINQQKKSRRYALLAFCLKAGALTVTLAGLLYGGYTKFWNKKVSGDVSLVPYTSLAFPLSGLYCESFTLFRGELDNSDASLSWSASVYIMPEKPTYDKLFNFTIANDNFTFTEAEDLTWYVRSVRLQQGSSYTVSSCILQGTGEVKLCIAKDESSYNSWVSTRGICSGTEYSLDYCVSNATHSAVVSDGTTYYFIHYTRNSTMAPNLKVNISIASAYFDADDASGVMNCTCSYFSKCSIDQSIPMTFTGFALITASVANNVSARQGWSWEDTIKVSWSCGSSVNPYLLIVVLPSVVGFVLYWTFLILFCRFGCRKLCRCCFKPLSKPWAVGIGLATVLIAVTPVVGVFTFMEGVLPFLAYNPTTELVLIPGSTRSFSINQFICSNLSFNTSGSSRLYASLYITDSTPSLNQSSTKIVNETLSCAGTKYCYKFWRAYLNENSSADITAYSDIFDEAYFLKLPITSYFDGFSNFMSDPQKYIIKKNRIPRNFSRPIFFSKSAEYAFVFVISKSSVIDVILQFHFTEFATPLHYQSVCQTHSYMPQDCKSAIPYGVGTSNAIIIANKDGEDENDDFEYLTVDTTCHPRASSWTALWLPVLAVNSIIFYSLTVTLFLCGYYQQQRRQRLREQPTEEDRQPLFNNEQDQNQPSSSSPQPRSSPEQAEEVEAASSSPPMAASGGPQRSSPSSVSINDQEGIVPHNTVYADVSAPPSESTQPSSTQITVASPQSGSIDPEEELLLPNNTSIIVSADVNTAPSPPVAAENSSVND